MQQKKWWTMDTVCVATVGALMAVIFGASMFARLGSSTGSDLVPAATLQKLRDQAAQCQTITDDEAVKPAPHGHC